MSRIFLWEYLDQEELLALLVVLAPVVQVVVAAERLLEAVGLAVKDEALRSRSAILSSLLLAQLIARNRSEAGRVTKIFAHLDKSDFELLVIIGDGQLLVCQVMLQAATSRFTPELFDCWLSLI